MKITLLSVFFGFIALSRAIAQDNVDPDTQAQIDAAKKQAEKMGVKMADIDKMMAEDETPKNEVAKRVAAAKPEALAALPVWIPSLKGFQPLSGTGTHWTDNEGKEQGTMRGTITGDPHAIFKKWEQSAKPQFSGPDTSWSPTIGNINGRHYVSLHAFRRDASGTDLCDLKLELDTAEGGKSTATVTYTQPAGGCGEKE